jgi:hypothetical protein
VLKQLDLVGGNPHRTMSAAGTRDFCSSERTIP